MTRRTTLYWLVWACEGELHVSSSSQVLSKDSANLLTAEENKYPGPMTEIKFWEAKCMNLESLYEQMKAQTTRNMASILENTDSAYYPVFRSMFRQG